MNKFKKGDKVKAIWWDGTPDPSWLKTRVGFIGVCKGLYRKPDWANYSKHTYKIVIPGQNNNNFIIFCEEELELLGPKVGEQLLFDFMKSE